MPEYLAPGVFIEEIERGPRPIEGVSTSTAAFLGETERGPTMPRMVTSFNEYSRYFGGAFGADKYMPYALSGFFENGGQRAFICRIVASGTPTAQFSANKLKLEAIGPGDWGKRIRLRVIPSTTTKGAPAEPVGFRLQIAYWQTEAPGDAYPNPFVASSARDLPRPTLVEDFDDLSWDANSPDYYIKRLTGNSALVRIPKGAEPVSGKADIAIGAVASDLAPMTLAPPSGGGAGAGAGAGGGAAGGAGAAAAAPGTVTIVDFKGVKDPPDERTGLAALELDAYREVALVAAPGVTGDLGKSVRDALFTHCENNTFRFAVTDLDRDVSDPATIDPRGERSTQYGAIYYPWVAAADLQSGVRKLIPPSGHVLGLYARTDVSRGVWKAPANDVLRGVFDLQYQTDTGKQQLLNPKGVNVIRQFPGRGIRVWGARTLSDNSLWKYVSVRRLFIFLEHSLYEGTQWVVFEPNDEKLWARVRDTIRLFLRTQWRNGAMMGLTEDEAFTIACDRSTMTQDDILNGRLVCEIGIAPVRPAEFVILRIFQNTAEAQS